METNYHILSPIYQNHPAFRWTEKNVADWLQQKHLDQFEKYFEENDINGELLMELDYNLLKQMGIPTVGDRVRLLTAIKELKRSHPGRPKKDYYREYIVPPPEKSESIATSKHSPIGTFNALIRRSKTLIQSPSNDNLLSTQSSHLSTTSSTRSDRSGFDMKRAGFLPEYAYSPPISPNGVTYQPDSPNTPNTPATANSLGSGSSSMIQMVVGEPTIMSMENVKKNCVRVYGDDGQTRIVDVHNAADAKSILKKVLHKFNINETPEKYAIFVVSGESTRSLSDEELVDICQSIDRPEKEKFILRKKHQPMSHEEFKKLRNRKHLERMEFSLLNPAVAQRVKLTKIFGKRPPSELISMNLSRYFPDHPNEELQEVSNLNNMESNLKPYFTEIPRSITKSSPSKLAEEILPENKESETNFIMDLKPKSAQVSPSIKQKSPILPIIELTRSNSPKLEQESPKRSPIPQEPPSPVEVKHSPVEESAKTLDVSTQQSSKAEEDTTTETKMKFIKGTLIGAGSFGNVYLGLNPRTGELMAVKQVELPTPNNSKANRQKSMLTALQREIDLLKTLNHPHIVSYLGSLIDDTHLNILLEYIPGGSVVGLLSEYGPFEEPMVRSFVRQILLGLDYLHKKAIIHRDIKGGNILLDNKGQVKITDFGISKKVQEGVLSVVTDHRASLQGSVYWMAPEVVKNTKYTPKADIW
jgi:mitogen-activated protein kinase kinase kinase